MLIHIYRQYKWEGDPSLLTVITVSWDFELKAAVCVVIINKKNIICNSSEKSYSSYTYTQTRMMMMKEGNPLLAIYRSVDMSIKRPTFSRRKKEIQKEISEKLIAKRAAIE